MNDLLVNQERVMAALYEVEDPEIGINIVDLGLVYGVGIEGSTVMVTMTLTTPGCPLHASVREAVERAVRAFVPGVTDVNVVLVWEPAWSPQRISDAGRAQLGWQ